MLNPKFFAVGLSEKKVYLDGINILSIILSLELGCHIYQVMSYRRRCQSKSIYENPYEVKNK
jgi:hypothetical protein